MEALHALARASAPAPVRSRYAPAGRDAPPASADGAAPEDRVTVSAEARRLAAGRGAAPAGRLTPEQERQVAELARRDAEVRAHEAAHQAAGGDLAGGASFTFQTGPDGRQYAIGGEVPIQLRSGRTPEQTIDIAQRVRRAALAPADPSPQDVAVAASATGMEQAARSEKLRAERAGRAYGKGARPSAGEEAAGAAGAEQGEELGTVT